MKKSILSIVMLLVVATATNAAPRFGIIGEQTAGLGAFITDDMYNAQVTFGSVSTEKTGVADNAVSKIKIGGNYKIALDSVTALTAGVSYTIKNDDADTFDSNNTIALSAGFERALSSNIVLTTQADIYSQNTDKTKAGAETKTTSIFSNGRVGVAYLF